jgi:hypothetical protein
MTIRRGSQRRGSLDSVLENLPERFREAEVYAENGTMTGLQAYMADLSEHLRQELGTEDPPTVDVMTALGIPPSEWYRALLTA